MWLTIQKKIMTFIWAKEFGNKIMSKNECSTAEKCEIRKGFVPMLVGNCGGGKERFMVPTQFIKHPSIIALLDLSAAEFGHRQQGVLQILCEPGCFRDIINRLSKRR
ncbi:hypothetical protein Ancab_007502 [Ancistrocladus abbreviatus]